MDLQDIEKLGAFYLGRRVEEGGAAGAPFLLDARALTTHAVCVGMTGSGKTGMCTALLEEAAIDGVPAIVIDPKGDLTNLALAFSDLAPERYAPFVDLMEARRQGKTVDQLASDIAQRWRDGLSETLQAPERIARFQSAVDVRIYTPGAGHGLALSPVRSLRAPDAKLLADVDGLRQRLTAAASGVLALLGERADPLQSREHILLARILEVAARQRRDLSLADLVREVQAPPFAEVGVLDVETFYPAHERRALALRLNALLAAPGFESWLNGEPLDIPSLLFAPDGRPRLSVLTLAHLQDAERMFVMTMLLGELCAWMRLQPGTASLRALLFIDEMTGFLPPVAQPPTKPLLLTLLKQARAFGLGVVLATQNPADLDYKALANAGTWLLGRLQTDRDRQRVLDGLESAGGVDRSTLDHTLASLPKRSFVVHSVHVGAPVVITSRCTLTYLAGPLAPAQIRELTHAHAPPAAAPTAPTAAAAAAPATTGRALPPAATSTAVSWRPGFVVDADVRFVDRKLAVDVVERRRLAWLDGQAVQTGDAAVAVGALPPGAVAQGTLAGLDEKRARKEAERALSSASLKLKRSAELNVVQQPGEDERALTARAQLAAREQRDAKRDEVRKKHERRLGELERKRASLLDEKQRASAEVKKSRLEVGIAVGTTLLGALFGRRHTMSTIRDAADVVRDGQRAAQASTRADDVDAQLRVIDGEIAEIEIAIHDELQAVDAVGAIAFDVIELQPARAGAAGGIEIVSAECVWLPVNADGGAAWAQRS